MKKLLLPLVIILFISCGYHKDSQITRDIGESESFYMVRVWPPTGFTNSGCLKIYYLPMEGISDYKVDSINKVADKYIEDCIKYTKN